MAALVAEEEVVVEAAPVRLGRARGLHSAPWHAARAQHIILLVAILPSALRVQCRGLRPPPRPGYFVTGEDAASFSCLPGLSDPELPSFSPVVSTAATVFAGVAPPSSSPTLPQRPPLRPPARRKERERGEMTWQPDMWGPRGSHAYSATT
uniref:Uncharacterized protein n=1 Tax=Oryza nivara TaxID=4536 RepID=A0A0E0FW72_ORYNI